jgi:hypothetical protein
MEADDICDRYADEKVGILLRLLVGEDGKARTVLAGGRPTALRMLGELLIARRRWRVAKAFTYRLSARVTDISTLGQNLTSTFTGFNQRPSPDDHPLQVEDSRPLGLGIHGARQAVSSSIVARSARA